MAFDEGLAERIRALLADLGEVSDRKMFGGIAFMLGDRMAVARWTSQGALRAAWSTSPRPASPPTWTSLAGSRRARPTRPHSRRRSDDARGGGLSVAAVTGCASRLDGSPEVMGQAVQSRCVNRE